MMSLRVPLFPGRSNLIHYRQQEIASLLLHRARNDKIFLGLYENYAIIVPFILNGTVTTLLCLCLTRSMGLSKKL
jgi:hypothetical protein